MARFINPDPQYLDGDGVPLVNGKLTFYAAGTNTKIITYADELESTPNTNPVLLDAAGRVPNVFFSGSARVILTADNLTTGQVGVQIFDRDPVGGEKELGDFTLWDSVVTYNFNDIVEGSNAKFYISLSNVNQGNDPVSTPAEWTQINFLGVYNTNQSYSIGNVAQTADGNCWASQIDNNVGNNPSVDSGTNWLPAIDGSKVPEVIALEALNVWINKAVDFTIVVRESYQIDASGGTVDAAMPTTLVIGNVITAHNESISTNTVLITNPSFTIKGPSGTIAAGTDMELAAGDTVKMVAKSTTILEVV